MNAGTAVVELAEDCKEGAVEDVGDGDVEELARSAKRFSIKSAARLLSMPHAPLPPLPLRPPESVLLLRSALMPPDPELFSPPPLDPRPSSTLHAPHHTHIIKKILFFFFFKNVSSI